MVVSENPQIRMFQGDCMEAMADMEENAYELAIVDPPYGIERFKKAFGSTRFKMDDRVAKNGIEWDQKPNAEYIDELFRISKGQIIWGANNFNIPPSEYFAIWNKKQTVNNFSSAEFAWVSPSLKQPAKIFDFSIHKHNRVDKIHPTQKPVDLYKWLLTNYATEGDRILDTHGGSGSIAIACYDMGFDLDWYELDNDYYEDAVERFKEHKKQGQLFSPEEQYQKPKQTELIGKSE